METYLWNGGSRKYPRHCYNRLNIPLRFILDLIENRYDENYLLGKVC